MRDHDPSPEPGPSSLAETAAAAPATAIAADEGVDLGRRAAAAEIAKWAGWAALAPTLAVLVHPRHAAAGPSLSTP